MQHTVFIAGATGYMGVRLSAALINKGDIVRALTRPASAGRLPAGCRIVQGDALDSRSWAEMVRPADTFVHLVGTPHPAPWKGREFIAVDLASLKESVAAALDARVGHFIYVSVAHPAPVMKAYIGVRTECERIIRESGLRATILRPWYVLGPGHWWPVALKPCYWLAERMPASRESALRLGLVTREQMVNALVEAVEQPPSGALRIVEAPEIRRATSSVAAGTRGAVPGSVRDASAGPATGRESAPREAAAQAGRRSA
ncbi:MAG: NAD(P)H-binding protein [Acidobacteria bacterium]|nr:NAD(P)H-binding protein [Acidobacteriota bacterium]